MDVKVKNEKDLDVEMSAVQEGVYSNCLNSEDVKTEGQRVAPVDEGQQEVPVDDCRGDVPVDEGQEDVPVDEGRGDVPVDEGQEDVPVDEGQEDVPVDEGQEDVPVDEGQKDALKEEKPDSKDPYFYLKRDEFTSEIFKIELGNLPKRFGFGQLRRKLLSLKLKPNKIKAVPFRKVAFITFRCEEDREAAITALDGHIWRGNPFSVKKANPTADPLQMKRKDNNGSDESCPAKKARVEEDELPWEARLKNSVTPLWEQSYEDQLKVKTDIIEEVLKRFSHQLGTQCPQLRKYLKQQRYKHEGYCCEVLPILQSPILKGYRNKCEFTLGRNQDGVEKTLGFRFGKYCGGSSSVGEPYDCSFMSERMKSIVKVFQEFFRSSQYPAFDPETHDGNWRQLTVRETRGGDVMVFPEFHPQNLSQEEVDAVIAAYKDYFTAGRGKDSQITSLFFSISAERITGTPVLPLRHVSGEKFITEDLMDMKFRISPDAFFQVNTLAAEVLYSKVADWCNLSPTTTLLDVCCGTGTIGLTMAKKVKKVVGVEMCQPAIEDAKQNAKLNGIDNAEYICAKAEDVMPGVTMRLDRDEEVVAVVDPPRAGLHAKVIRTLRHCSLLKKVIYVSCSPQSAVQNFLDLCRPTSRKVHGAPYQLTRVIPVDLFPQTKLCELILQFDREETDFKPEESY